MSVPYTCLALDVGGVICADTWESLFFAPLIGLMAHYKLDPAQVMKKGDELWDQYAYAPREEEDYWKSWEQALNRTIDRALIAQLYTKAIWADASAAAVIKKCLENGMQVAFVSNSTAFWFPRQMKRAGLEKMEPKCLRFLSHETGLSKTHAQGGLAQLAAKVKPEQTVFVDDRSENTAVAQELGMTAVYYQRQVHGDLAAALKDVGL